MTVKNKPLGDGVYIGLPAEDYFAQDALGTTDLVHLWKFGEGWWWRSRHNPLHIDEPSEAMTFGSALHVRLLEGRQEFERRFAIEPRKADFPGLLTTSDEIKYALLHANAPKPAASARKSDLVELALTYLPDRPVWDDVIARFRAEAKERGQAETISGDDAREIEIIAEAATADPQVAAALEAQGGVPLTELSVFWTPPGGPRQRYRFDSLLPFWGIDLKSIDNFRGGEFAAACAARIRDGALDVQMAQSFEARKAIYQAIAEKRVFGGDTRQRRWLMRFPREAPLEGKDGPQWRWLWVFTQRPDSKAGRAPMILPVDVTFGDDLHREGYRKAWTAIYRYRAYVAEFGFDRPWVRALPVHSLQGRNKHQIFLPPWGEAAMRVPDEDRALEWRKS